MSDDYPSCARTYATLRVIPDGFAPDEVTEALGVSPTVVYHAGKSMYPARPHVLARQDAWHLRSTPAVESTDAARHIDWILDQIEPRALALAGIQARAAEVSLSCFWVSAHGHGGPSLLPGQMQRLAALNLPLWFDIYFDDDEADA